MRLRTFSVIGDVYFICLEIPQNFARNKKNCIFAKDLILKAEFRKKIWLIDTSLHTVDVTQQLARVFELFQSLAMFTLLYLP